MKSSGKIIIKPRAPTRNTAATARALSETESEPQLPQVKDENETENDQVDDADDENDNLNDEDNEPQNQQPEDEDGADVASAAPDPDDPENDAEGEAAPAPVKRGRGRPKGSTKSSGTSTPRGRPPKARGRPRGRGRPPGAIAGLTIRLKAPKGEGEEETDEEITTEAEAVPVVAEVEADVVETKEIPMGGGKPFRKIGDKVHVIEGDEFVTEDDPKGDEKIDKWGNLLGGRKFKASTFTLPNRHPHRQYMLAIDAARTSGFRDSLYYFRRNPLAFKLNATQPEKDYLISEGKLGSHLRTRSVTLTTARSAFKLHGSKMIIDGRWVTDDYYEEKVLAEITAKGLQAGDLVGELPDPNAPRPQPDLDSSLANSAFASSSNVNVAGGGGIYRAGGPTTIFGGSGWGPFSDGPLNAVRKSLLSRDGVTEENWAYMMAGRVGEADEEWARLRKEARGRAGLAVDGVVIGGRGSAWERPDVIMEDVKDEKSVQNVDGGDVGVANVDAKARKQSKRKNEGAFGVYEPHTHLVFYRTDTQPTRAKWLPVPDSSKRRILGGSKAGNGAWSIACVDTLMQLPEEDEEARAKQEEEQREREAKVRGAEEMFGRSASVASGRGDSTSRALSVVSTRGMSVGV